MSHFQNKQTHFYSLEVSIIIVIIIIVVQVKATNCQSGYTAVTEVAEV